MSVVEPFGIRTRQTMRSGLARGAGLAFAIIAIGAGLKYLMQILFARWMGPSGYGTFAIIWNLVHVLAFLAAPGLPIVGLRFMSEYLARSEIEPLIGLVRWTHRAMAGFGALAAVAAFAWLRLFVPEVDAAAAVAVGLAVPIYGAVLVYTEWLRATGSVALAFGPPQLLVPALAITIGGTSILLGQTMSTFVAAAAMVSASAACLGVQRAGLVRRLPRLTAGAAARSDGHRWTRSAGLTLLQGASSALLSQWDILIVGVLLEPTDAGIYSAAVRTSLLVSLGLQALNSVVAPLISAHHVSGDYPGLQRLVRSAARWVFVPTLVVSAVFLLAPEWVLGLFGDEFTDAAWALRWLAIGQIVNATTGPVGYVLVMTDNQGSVAAIFAVSALVSIVMSVVLIGPFGIVGAALATALALSLANLLLYNSVRQRTGIRCFVFARDAGSNEDTAVPGS